MRPFTGEKNCRIVTFDCNANKLEIKWLKRSLKNSCISEWLDVCSSYMVPDTGIRVCYKAVGGSKKWNTEKKR